MSFAPRTTQPYFGSEDHGSVYPREKRQEMTRTLITRFRESGLLAELKRLGVWFIQVPCCSKNETEVRVNQAEAENHAPEIPADELPIRIKSLLEAARPTDECGEAVNYHVRLHRDCCGSKHIGCWKTNPLQLTL